MLQENLHAEDGGVHFHLRVLPRVEADLEEAAPNPPTQSLGAACWLGSLPCWLTLYHWRFRRPA